MIYTNDSIINCTPHECNIYTGSVFDPACGKCRGGELVMTIPASGVVGVATPEIIPDEPFMVGGLTIPSVRRKYVRVSPLFDEEGKLYIVSAVYAEAAKQLGYDTTHLLTPNGHVINDRGMVIGCTGFARV